MGGLLQKEQSTVARGEEEGEEGANAELLNLGGWVYKWCL
jgi:hypothetical protein